MPTTLIDPQQRICDIDGQTYLLVRRGKKNSRIARIDAKHRRTVGESFIVNSLRLEKIRGADELWLGQPNSPLQAKRSQTVRLDSDVAEQLASFAARNSESINDALLRLLRRRSG
jgi:hypothetical protein